MDEKIDAVLPPVQPRGKQKQGRPKIQVVAAPLHNLPGETKEDKLLVLYERWKICTRCPLGQGLAQLPVPHEIVFGDGNPNSGILIVGEAPGEEEQKNHAAFIGAAGQTLNQLLAMVSDDPDIQQLCHWYQTAPRNNENFNKFHDSVYVWRQSEFFITNVVSCRPPDNRPPSNAEVKECWERLWNIIYIIDPLLIIVCGNSALAAVTRKATAAQITKMRGQIFDIEFDGKVRKFTYPVVPILHPSFLNRVADWKLKDGSFAKTLNDLKMAMRMVDFLRNQHFGTPIPRR